VWRFHAQGSGAKPLPFLSVAVLLGLGVLLGLLALRQLGVLQSLELKAYDAFLRLLRLEASPDPRITLIAIDEVDIARHGWPLRDDALAGVLEKLLRAGPRVLGIDLFRDRPEPPGTERLERLLREDARLVAVMKYPDAQGVGVAPPPALDDPSRVGFADMVVDPDGTVRRGLLFLGGGEQARWSLALRLATAYLAPLGIVPAGDEEYPRLLKLGTATYAPLASHEGGYAGIDSRGYQFLLTYPVGQAGFTTLGLGQVLDGRFAAEDVRDRVVVLGTTAQSVKDVFFTPLAADRADFGIELHAQVVGQLIRQALGEARPLRPVPWPVDAVWIAVWCILGGAAALILRSRFPLLLAVAIGVVLLGLSAWGTLALGWWIALVPSLVGGLATLLLQAAWLVRFEHQELDALMRLFTAHLSPRIAAVVWQQRHALREPGQLGSQSLEATVLFSDLSDFTTMSEAMTPTILMAWLNQYISALTEVVSRHGGVVLELTGDGLLAVFGVPVRRASAEEVAEDARNAVRCALAMGDALTGLNDGFRARGLPEVAIRVGIHTGPLVAGRLGSEARCKYAVVGDTVNIAARLEQYGKSDPRLASGGTHCRILLSGATCACLERGYDTVALGRLDLKGKTASVTIHCLVGKATGARRTPVKVDRWRASATASGESDGGRPA
jgi:adenylate cyclase